MNRRALAFLAFATIGTGLAIACSINPQPLPPEAFTSDDAGTALTDSGGTSLPGPPGTGSSSSSSGSSGTAPSDSGTAPDAATDAAQNLDAATDAPTDADNDAADAPTTD